MKREFRGHQWIWVTYFVLGGFVCSILWNSILNLTEYLAKAFPNFSFTFVAFSYRFGGIMAFFVAPFVFGRLSHKKYINTSLFFGLILFLTSFYMCEATSSEKFNVILTFASFFFLGFFNAAMQLRLAGMAAYISNKNIVLFSFGTGLVGILWNVLAWVIDLIIFGNTTERPMTGLRWMVLSYAAIIAVIFIAFFVFQIVFDVTFPLILKCESNTEIEEILARDPQIHDEDHNPLLNEEKNTPKNAQLKQNFSAITPSLAKGQIFRRSFDLLIGLSFLYICTIAVIAFFDMKTYFAFDRKSRFVTIPIYMLIFNFFDTIGKFFPPRFLIRSTAIMHSLNFLRAIFPVHMAVILYTRTSAFWCSENLRIFSNIVMGFSNGYFTNSFMTLIPDRFQHKGEKSQGAYLSVLFLYVGVVSGTFLNTIFDNFEENYE